MLNMKKIVGCVLQVCISVGEFISETCYLMKQELIFLTG